MYNNPAPPPARQAYTAPRVQEKRSRQVYQSTPPPQITTYQLNEVAGFSNMVETTKCAADDIKVSTAPPVAKYNPYETNEHKADIPFLHPVEVQQVIHDTRVVMVPQPVPKQIIHEKLITEKPTEIHHIQLEKSAAPVAFAEIAPAAAGWPWWWWIPLLLLCCCLPLC